VILDVDATQIEAEKQEAEWTYQKVKGYMPLPGYAQALRGAGVSTGKYEPWGQGPEIRPAM